MSEGRGEHEGASPEEPDKGFRDRFSARALGRFARDTWREIPMVETVRTYRWGWFRRDFVAGGTVALLDVPQAIAYAWIAGLPPSYGLYSSIVLAAVSSLFVNSNQMICGPTNAIALVTAGALANAAPVVRDNPAAGVAVLVLLIGVIQASLGLLKAGNLSQFVSRSVLVGFTAGAGLLIALSQVPAFFGIEVSADTLIGKLAVAFADPSTWNPHAVGIALFTVVVIWLGRRWKPSFPWALAAVVASAGIVYGYGLDRYGVALVGAVPSALPGFALPEIRWPMVADLAGDALAIAILGCIESLSIAKTIAVSTGQRVRSSQDFLGLGIAHIAGAFHGCMPGCGSFTRSALNHQSGAMTRVAGLVCAGWVAVAVVALGPAAGYIPKASLAGLLVVLGAGLIHWKEMRISLRATRSDAVVMLLTLFATLVLHLDTAIYIGVIASLVLFLRKASAPHLVEYDMEGDLLREIRGPGQRSHPQISIIHVEGELFFGAAELFEEQVRRLARDPNIRVVVLRMKNARHLDATAVMALDSLRKFLSGDQRLLLISGASADVMRVLRGSGYLKRAQPDTVFPAEENLTAATRKALLRAKEFLGGEHGEVRVFYEKSRATAPASPPSPTAP